MVGKPKSWFEYEIFVSDDENEPCVSVPYRLMVLHLIEWLVDFLQVRKYDNIASVCRKVETSQKESGTLGSRFVSVTVTSDALLMLLGSSVYIKVEI
ncbi:hypothetical protein AMTR_s00100p00140080 [Amborella trichopoda]|uniref:Uncharacterized protein n=1 Tax=Amborella trichopoda TaxID=13333 RepID=W1P0I1_AMBTC|nr:hypothetical protein AMTR_s00100p00140080 [Amborella trichopoda]